MEFQPGDRVKCVKKYPRLSIGESGTYLGRNNVWNDAAVRWDKYKKGRHDCDRLCDYGYGWFVPFDRIELDEPIDLGGLPEVDDEASSFLFGL